MIRALVTGCNVNFLPGARAALRSCRAAHPEVVRYCYAPPGEVAAVQAGLGDLGTALAPPRTLRTIPEHWKPQLMAARAFMALLPADATAWIDSDAILCAPAPELWEVKPGRVHAVRDAVYNLGRMVPAEAWDGYARAFGAARTDPGFNSGVMALRNADWRDLPERYERAVTAVGYRLYPHGFDQPLLNGILRDAVDWLPREFNAHATYELGVPAGVRVLHFTDSPKPWLPGFSKFQAGYPYWLRHGLGRGGPGAAVYGRLARPATLGYKAARKLLTLAGLWKHSLGVSDDGTFLPNPNALSEGTTRP